MEKGGVGCLFSLLGGFARQKCFSEQSHLSQGMGSHPVLCLEPTHCGTARGPLCAGGSSDSHKATGREHKQEHTPVQALYRDSNLPPQKLPLIGRRLKSSLLEFGVGLVMPAGYSAAYSASKDLNLVRSSIKQQLAHC